MKVFHMFALAATMLTAPLHAAALDDPAAAFGARESIQDVALSPDGRGLVYVAPGPGTASNVFAIDLSTGQGRVVATSQGDPMALRSCEYAGTDRIVCLIYGIMENGDLRYSVSRQLAVDTDGGDPQTLGQRRSSYAAYGRQSDGRVIDWLPDEDGEVLMSRIYVPEAGRVATRIVDRNEGLGVDRIDTRTGRATRVEAPVDEINLYMADGQGHVRVMGSNRSRGATFQASDEVRFYYRTPGDSAWRDLSTYNLVTRGGFWPLDVDPELNAVYGLQPYQGRDALYRMTLDGNSQRELVFANDHVDIDDVVRIGRAGRIIGVTFAEERRHVEFFDEEYKALAESLSRAIPNLPLIRFAGATDDENILLIHASSDNDPGRYYIYDKTARSLNETMLSRPELEDVPLASVRPVHYAASDGTQIPGYLTMPPGHEEDRGLPAIVIPHGGPGARDEWGFDWLAQYFAHQGYVVLQPNFRGSAGYGNDWFVENGFRGWQTAIGDVDAGGHWLVSEGIADPSRLGILGWSYGGYAALQSGVLEPGLFKAIIAIAPVTDLALMRDMSRNFSDAANLREFLGDGPHIAAGSPAQNAARFTAPVLLFHGDRDANVSIRQSLMMEDRLKDAGKSVEFVRFEGLDHQLPDSAARATMLRRSDAFLRNAFGMSAPAATPEN